MHAFVVRLPHILLASTFALSGIAAAEPTPPPASPTLVPVPSPTTAARDPASGLPTGKRMHKPYTIVAEPQTLQATAISWGARGDAVNSVVSDPEEGGEVSAAKSKGHPKVSDITVMKTTDKASAALSAAEPPPSGTARVTVALHACVKGTHIKEATIVHRSSRYTLHDVDVDDCVDSGDTTTCTLSYQGLSE